ncbi:hypothetical protein EYV94_22840 [Puteibacter caeruleilacunae]|nr:hypothetical protein EYV94_22840 [Puteibacter caeruleilacunae]
MVLIFNFVFTYCFAQTDNLEIKVDSSRYFVDDSEHEFISYKITNTSDSTIIFWLQKDQKGHNKEKYKIRDYFFYRGNNDFCFADLINEKLISGYVPNLYETFAKRLKSRESFSFIIISKEGRLDKRKILSQLKQQLVFVKESTLRNFLSIEGINLFLFKRNNIIILTPLCGKSSSYVYKRNK